MTDFKQDFDRTDFGQWADGKDYRLPKIEGEYLMWLIGEYIDQRVNSRLSELESRVDLLNMDEEGRVRE